MVTFSCKKISQEELIRCAFVLNKTEYNTLIFFLGKNKKYTASQVSKEMKLDRTTVQKAIKKLFEKNLLKRSQINLSSGGYTFLYRIRDKKEIKREMKTIVYNWYRGVEESINRL